MQVCAEPGCPELTPRSRCQAHERAFDRRRRPSSRERYGDDYTPALRKRILERDNYTCQLRLAGCRVRATTVDHLLPRSLGGANTESNLVAACGHCNTAKADRLDWWQDQKARG